jgi:exosortase/archaeosortase family protein
MAKLSLKIFQQSKALLYEVMNTWHGRFVLAGLTIGLFYLPVWLQDVYLSIKQGSDAIIILFSAILLALWQIWPQRKTFTETYASEEDQVLGHLLIAAGIIMFPVLHFAIWPQSLLWLLVLAGIAVSTWGAKFFVKFPLISLLIALTVYPRPSLLARLLWETFTPPRFLDRIMATASAFGLQLIGQPAVAEGSFVTIPSVGAVDVNWDCNGFAMACTIAASGLIMGLLLKQPWPKISMIMLTGFVMGLIFNIPRIMLLTMASVYWGQESFDFWHSNWGSQIVAGLILTVYYYVVMAMVNRRPKKAA